MSAHSESSEVMRTEQQSMTRAGARWGLPAGVARRLTIGPRPRWLQVSVGRVWLTTTGGGDAMDQDRWLQVGDAVLLPSGTEVVLEAWGGEACFELLVPPQACARAAAGIASLPIGPWLQRLAAAAGRRGASTRPYLPA